MGEGRGQSASRSGAVVEMGQYCALVALVVRFAPYLSDTTRPPQGPRPYVRFQAPRVKICVCRENYREE